MRKIILILVIVVVALASSQAKDELKWPLFKAETVDTHWQAWNGIFYALMNNSELHSITPDDRSASSKFLYSFDKRPDMIRHFPLDNQDNLVVSVFKEGKKLLLTGFHPDAEEFYK